MTERPILFSGPMVRAILAGRKTQTRRVVKGTALEWLEPGPFTPEYVAHSDNALCPYGVPGDRLWVRETWTGTWCDKIMHLAYAADGAEREIEIPIVPHDAVLPKSTVKIGNFAPSIHMPRWASRITLEITGVRVERLQDISEADAECEGVECYYRGGVTLQDHPRYKDYLGSKASFKYCAKDSFVSLWSTIHAADGPHGWKANPWVWVVEFRREVVTR